MKALKSQKIEKPWGHERILVKTDSYVVKEIYVKAGHRLSLQYHNKKIETLLLIEGDGRINLERNGKMLIIKPSKLYPTYVGRKAVHRIYSKKTDSLWIEVSSTELDDVVRIEDDYGRTE